MKRPVLIVALLVLLVVGAFAQTQPEVIDDANFNYALLNKLILEKINAKRQKLHVGTLSPDSILYLAAKNQADYQVKEDVLTHFQKKKQTKDPVERVKYYNGQFYAIAENAAMEFWGVRVKEKDNKVHIYTTYEEVAEAFVDGWIHSPIHYTNLKEKIYDLSGVATSINLKQKKIFAVQVFGKK